MSARPAQVNRRTDRDTAYYDAISRGDAFGNRTAEVADTDRKTARKDIPLRKETENSIQSAFFSWCAAMSRQMPELDLMHSIPNGAHKSRFAQRLYKATGLKAGVPDVSFPVARCDYHGMYIEFKTSTGRTSPAQKVWIASLRQQGYLVPVCRDWKTAADIVTAYLKGDKEVADGITSGLK